MVHMLSVEERWTRLCSIDGQILRTLEAGSTPQTLPTSPGSLDAAGELGADEGAASAPTWKLSNLSRVSFAGQS
jgi:hypothetical protein